MKAPGRHFVKAILISACIVLYTAQINLAQESEFQFEHLLLPGGDLANFVTNVTQDSLGFMWFSTWNGLYRYDGYSFTNYVHDPADSTSLSANWVETVYVDRSGTLWAGTFGGGLNRFNPDTETFTRFRHIPNDLNTLSRDSVTVITEDHLGQLWVGTMGGLNRMDRETGNFTRYTYDSDDSTSLGNNQVGALYEDDQGILWVGTNSPFGDERNNPGPGGLNRFNRDSETFTRYLHDPNNPNSLISNHVMSIFEDSRGTLWIGTFDDGLHTMNRDEGTFTRYTYNPNDPNQLSAPHSNRQPDIVGGVTFIYEDDEGFVWFGSFGGGLNRYNPETESFLHFEQNPDNPASLSTNGLWNMYQSQDGTHWITMIPGGLNKIQSTQSPFDHYTLTPMHSNNFLTVLHADNSGILRVNSCCPEGITVSFKMSVNENSNYAPITTSIGYEDRNDVGFITIEQTKDDTIWVGVYEGSQTARNGGLYQIIPETNELTPILTDSTNDGKHIGPITAIHEGRDQSVWLGTKYTGLFRLNRKTGMTTQYSYDPKNPSGISHESITTIYESISDPGALWIGTEGGGLNRFDIESETFTRYQNESENPNSLNGEYVTSIYEDRSGNLYIGTRKSGLNLFDKSSDQFAHFTEYNSGLPDNNIPCILGDEKGHIWMGTSHGLASFDPESQLFYTYGERHGVRAQPYIESCDIDRAGRFIFGGANGFTVFHPDNIETDISEAPVVFTNFLLRGQPVEPDPSGLLQTPVWMSNDIRLPHNDNTFSFDFAALDYRDPESNQYMYQLEGYDQVWRNAGNQRRATYNQVPFGSYLFRVRAANSEGFWNQEEASIQVTILPPWWRTWWAYGLYGLLLIAGIFAADRIQRKRLIAKERERARERELEQEKAHARQLEEAYSDLEDSLKKLTAAQDQLVQQEKLASLGQLTAGIAHEIKNPLNFVNNFSELSVELIDEAREEIEKLTLPDENFVLDILDDIESNLKKINEHGTRADGIVKSMLQHSRGGSGKVEPTDINAIIKEYVNLAFHGMRAGKNPINVDIDLDLDENAKEIPLIAEDFSRVILNLCNNAFDAMREKLNKIDNHSEKSDKYLPKLNVSTRQEDGYLRIEIQDNGPGIPAEFREKILQPFFTTKKGKDGTGLGLSITNDIVKSHGGNIDIQSESGNYTRFSVTIPYKNQ